MMWTTYHSKSMKSQAQLERELADMARLVERLKAQLTAALEAVARMR
jgi:hypothetical protein